MIKEHSIFHLLTEDEMMKVWEYLYSRRAYEKVSLNWIEFDEKKEVKVEQMYEYKLNVITDELGKLYSTELNCVGLHENSYRYVEEAMRTLCENYRLTIIKVIYDVNSSVNKKIEHEYTMLLISEPLVDFLQFKKIIA